MLFLYNLTIYIAGFFLKIIALFSPKIKLFVEGRKNVFSVLEEKIKANDKTIWFHSASLGEYEQGLPVIEKIKEKYPSHKIIVTFFSPSGYEVRKNNTVADVTIYLPLDTKSNAKRFLKLVHPEFAFFIKYEFWLNYLNELEKSKTSTYLISGIFRDSQMFFKWYGGFYRKALNAFTYFFVQNESSKQKIEAIGFKNVIVSGDTRFDRVNAILERDNILNYVENFKNNQLTIVIGSSWPKDEVLLIEYINQAPENVKFIIAPHNIKTEQISNLKSQITKSTVLFSEKENKDLSNYNVFIIDTIGILTKIYSYGTIAYVGGGFGNPGIHNILEPATFGIPIVIGPNYSNFAEAVSLVELGGCISITNFLELKEILDRLINDPKLLTEKSHICKSFIQNNKGATNTIMKIVS
ncbi:3-deoxy-D-manno-octulosonic acid transferase [Flavobacterium johnsoniae]|uniref:3-deoxy-D-manno-octulosonic acid transferase n=1 Tax=Flavobacterium johnsoniae (strain ATCC 17061 / DSM 2064 / JCM 8514 / BCRC 14874 / CCUG 350202 / NBRC 14942 / NCIMB 11054 / UW101) TaxID=376686 RepID=A5FJ66_FLAJ1|nr:glycosyltransferase N-terminal domain-containing protein [Flavobacterium johnsoniae]ABQ04758.1 CMP-KDO: KDO-transferase-like protein; Glycosyltransferase family 30 [Flavobacterium johnsoniae UW101]OXE96400.1 3-deoxy-D-manno-octulosonic acid transferase [Flavobacterium johnsoniae UW101]WQG83444.1 glycosyltransferase N-terminal domain-containing protein [Flavobacterium johnsoniae UW101]SHK32727.1 3-deoxy-D-manno-octulosonic-acid transferase [Flavobacterium johnsoniae]